MISKDQARRSAQLLYPELWTESPVEAVAKAVEFLHEAASSHTGSLLAEPLGRNNEISGVIKSLSDHMRRAHMHVNVIARALQVSTYTVRTWLEGKYKPNEENAKKISELLANLQATPELLKRED